MTKEQLLNEHFLDARAHLLDVAAFMDRLDRASGSSDYRLDSFHACLSIIQDDQGEKTRRILERLSDPTTEPIEKAFSKGASGAWPGFSGINR